MKKFGKKYETAKGTFDAAKYFPLDEAVQLLVTTGTTKFDSTAEIHFHLNADPKYADQMVRGTVPLPHGTGKEVRVIAFVSEDKVKEAKDAGAIKAGGADLIDEVAKGFVAFDIAVATPDLMRDLAKVAKVLGPKGLMPNPKSGTVTTEIGKTIDELKKGKVEFKTDKFGIVHGIFGKMSFGAEKLTDNLKMYVAAVLAAKPTGVKGIYVKSLSLASTMGPGIKVDTTTLSK